MKISRKELLSEADKFRLANNLSRRQLAQILGISYGSLNSHYTATYKTVSEAVYLKFRNQGIFVSNDPDKRKA